VEGLWTALEAYLGAEQVELDDLELAGRTLRVIVDAEGGLDLERISELSRGLSRLLDENDDFLGERYNLEVTSPGLERKLRRPRHYEKSVGRELVMKTKTGEKLRGELAAANEESLRLVVDGVEHALGYEEVASARTVFALPSKPKPGKQGKPRKQHNVKPGEQAVLDTSLTGES
jgi:ribosome maturation factor RimP